MHITPIKGLLAVVILALTSLFLTAQNLRPRKAANVAPKARTTGKGPKKAPPSNFHKHAKTTLEAAPLKQPRRDGATSPPPTAKATILRGATREAPIGSKLIEGQGAVGPLRFLSIGDWGGTTKVMLKIAHTMGGWCDKQACDFIVSTGDNFYPDGVKGLSDPQFSKTFANVFTAASLQVRWYVCLGNHDHRGRTKPQIEYTKQSNIWYMPAVYYHEAISPPNYDASNGPLLDLYVIDSYDKRTWKEQLKWLGDKFAASTGRWRAVLNHNPIWSGGTIHGTEGKGHWSRVTQATKKALYPVLMKGKVHFYLSGDDHSLQVIERDGAAWFVSGAGGGKFGAGMFQIAHKMQGTKFESHSKGGFFEHELNYTHLRTRSVDLNGKVMHTHAFLHP